MKTITYSEWDWENDVGIGLIEGSSPLPGRHALVLLDDRSFPFRVIVRNPRSIRVIGSAAEEVWVYDYFCDGEGRILEKRSLAENSEVALIVRYEYEGGTKVAECGWSPTRGRPPSRRRV